MVFGFQGPKAATFILVAVMVFATYEMDQMKPPSKQKVAHSEHIAERASDFSIRRDVANVLFRNGHYNLARRWNFDRVPRQWAQFIPGAFVLLPLSIGLALASLSLMRRSGTNMPVCDLIPHFYRPVPFVRFVRGKH